MKNNQGITDYHFAPILLLRTPLFPWKQWGEISPEAKRRQLDQAIAYASPDLHAALDEEGRKNGKRRSRIRTAHWHYENRAHFRPTPFGLFSCFSSVSWTKNKEGLCLSSQPQYHVQESMVLKGRARESLSLDTHLRFQVNPSVYALGKSLRYLHYQFEDQRDRRRYCLRSVPALPWLENFLRRFESRIFVRDSAFRYWGDHYSFSPEDCLEAWSGMVREGLILPWQALSLTGPVPIERHDNPDSLQRAFPPSEKSKENPYVNAERSCISGGLNQDFAPALQGCLDLIHRLKPYRPPAETEAFRRAFQKKFEQNAVPLMDALDPVAGIPYPPPGFDSGFPGQDPRVQAFLTLQWAESRSSGKPIRIRAQDLDRLEIDARQQAPLPPSLAVLFRVHDQELYLENAGGSQGTAILGRFTPFDSRIRKACRDMAALECRSQPHLLFAELVHLEDYHLANIERRHPLYPYEICFHEGGGMRRENQIPVSDLMLSVQEDQLILWSRQHGKRVIPRLSTAFNPQYSALPVFRLLAELSAANCQTDLQWSLEEYLPLLDHYPRVYMEGVLVGRETWAFSPPKEGRSVTWAYVKERLAGAASRGLPEFLSLDRADQQLVFDLKNPRDQGILVQALQSPARSLLKEWIPPAKGLVQDEQGNDYSHQFVAMLHHSKPRLGPEFHPPRTRIGLGPRRWETRKSADWTYFKIYLPAPQISAFLAEKLGPWIQELKKECPRLSWFFVRYVDPEPHIRLRMQHGPLSVLRRIERGIAWLRKQEREGQIRRFEIAPYQPEWLRYPPSLLSDCEAIFHASSEWVLQLLLDKGVLASGMDYPPAVWAPLNALCQGMGWPLESRKIAFETLYRNMARDQSWDLAVQKKQKALHHHVVEAWKKRHWESSPQPEEWRPLLEAIRRNAQAMMASSASLPAARTEQLMADLFHLHLNRHLDLGSRDKEILIYYLMGKKYSQLCHFQSTSPQVIRP